jgi:threonine synthase
MKPLQPAQYILTCSGCGNPIDKDPQPNFIDCNTCGPSPIFIDYDLNSSIPKSYIDTNERSMWRYRHFLPLTPVDVPISLGEGWTPLLSLENLGKQYSCKHLSLKDESLNPTGSFKARGLSLAITKAKSAGITCCIVPTAGNAGGAMSAYCAKAGIKAIVVMPAHTPMPFQVECKMFGAEVILVEGLINDCARMVTLIKKERDCYDLSTMKEPYRLEGKKTLGYEIAEQFNWKLPQFILYPTGGGTGLIGIWKAFKEMQAMGWISGKLPKMIAVQAENCQPIAATVMGLQKNASSYTGHPTIANGLAVPNPFAERLILQVLNETKGTVIIVSESEIQSCWKEMCAKEGLLVAPEGAALLAGLKQLRNNGLVTGEESILLLNTGSGYKYLDNIIS